MRLLFVASAVGPLGTGISGGVEHNLLNLSRALIARGHRVDVVAPAGSQADRVPIVRQVEGLPPTFAQAEDRTAPVILPQPALVAGLWEAACELQTDYDLIVNWGYDWLPFYLTPFFKRPVLHVVSMGSLLDSIDRAVAGVIRKFPGTVAVHSLAQAATFAAIAPDAFVLQPCGMDLNTYDFQPLDAGYLAWVGRVAPEKGIEDALAAAAASGYPLHILGRIQDARYFETACAAHPGATVHYRGFLETRAMQAVLGGARALLVTPRWIEAFGNVVVEALACGVPVVAYRRGGPAEIVVDGVTGFLVNPDDPAALVAAVANLEAIDRRRCRAHAEAHYSLERMADRFESWFQRCRP